MSEREFSLALRDVTKDYDGARVLDVPELDVRRGEFFSLLGPSGSGKTTTLRLVAGFDGPTSGRIRVDGRDMARVRAEDRGIGLVFQNYALFPHMTVGANVAFPLQMRSRSKADIRRRVTEVLDLVDLAAYRDRNVALLSGGQQQRVAIARAIVFEPALLLMDEPLGALDRRLRTRLQTELRELHRALGITIVYVTHDQEEAMSLSDRVAIMNHGRIAQLGPPAALYDAPASLFVSNFLGDNNTFSATVAGGDRAELAEGAVIGIRPTRADAAGVELTIRPERVRLAADDGSAAAGSPAGGAASRLAGVITDVVALGATTQYRVRTEGVGPVWASVQNSAGAFTGARDDRVAVHWDLDDVHVFARSGGDVLTGAGGEPTAMAATDA